MIRSRAFITLLVLSIIIVACGKTREQVATTESTVTEAGGTATYAAAPSSTTSAAPVQPASSPAIATAAPAPGVVLATQETNWSGIAAEVTEFKRKGNTLTAKVRFRNSGTESSTPDIRIREAYLMDANAGKKYEVLRDEKSVFISSLTPGYSDRWWSEIKGGGQMTMWMKFPAPPAEVKAVTLQLPGIPPFEDVAIQD